jgi:hypothetical protein
VKNTIRIIKISAIIFSSIILLAGCSVGIRPAYYDLPPMDDNQIYYGEPAYSPGYYTTPYKYDYGSTYDPWTMGTYYNYTPPQRVSRDSQSSASSDSSNTNDDKRPTMRDRGTSSDTQSLAPKRESSSLRTERVAQRTTETSTSSATSSARKTRREASTDSSSSQPSDNEKKDDEEQNIKRKRGVTE